MMMNSNLILQAGQGADILGAMQRGNALAGQVNDQRRQNALAGFMKENGAALMQGDQNVLAQYAQYDPQAAMGIMERQQDRQWRADERDYQRQRDAVSDRRQDRQFAMQEARYAKQDERADLDWKWKVEEYAAKKSQAEREAEAAQIEGAVKMGLAAQTPEQWDQIVTQAGAADLVGQFENRQAIVQRYMSVADILKGQQPPAPLSPQGKFNVDQRAGLIDADAVYQPGGNTTVNVGGENSDLRKELSKKEGEQWAAAIEGGNMAAGTIQDLDMLDELMTVAPQGPIQGRLAQAFPGANSAADAMTSIISRVAPTLRAPGSGATSDIEYEGMVRSLPSLRNRPEANAAIAGMMRAKAVISQERARIVADYQNGDLNEREARQKMDEINSRSIMTPQLKQLISATGNGQGSSDVPEGMDPEDWKFMSDEDKALFR